MKSSGATAPSGPDEATVDARRLRQSLEAICREHEALRAHVTQLHAYLATKKDEIPASQVVDLLRLSVAEMTKQRDQLREHVDVLHKKLAERALEKAIAPAATPERRVQSARGHRDKGAKQLNKQDIEEVSKRLHDDGDKLTRKLQEERARHEQALLTVPKVGRKALNSRFLELEGRAKKWADSQKTLREAEDPEQRPDGSSLELTPATLDYHWPAPADPNLKLMSPKDIARSASRLHERGARPRRAPMPTDDLPAWGSIQAQRGSAHSRSAAAIQSPTPRTTKHDPGRT